MGEFKAPVPLSRLHTYEVDGVLVSTNVDPVFLLSLPGDEVPVLRRLAREFGRPVVEDVAS
jgi:hypothetical protein